MFLVSYPSCHKVSPTGLFLVFLLDRENNSFTECMNTMRIHGVPTYRDTTPNLFEKVVLLNLCFHIFFSDTPWGSTSAVSSITVVHMFSSLPYKSFHVTSVSVLESGAKCVFTPLTWVLSQSGFPSVVIDPRRKDQILQKDVY